MAIVYVICSDHSLPSGGIMKLYELVDILNANGFRSFLVHKRKNFRNIWFENSTQIIDYQSVKLKFDDIIVLPEGYAALIPNICPGVRKIIYNQNSFNTLRPFYDDPFAARLAYIHPDVIQVLTVSTYDLKVLRSIFPSANISMIPTSINEKLFHFCPNKSKTIAVMPRKMPDDFIYLMSFLSLGDQLNGYKFKVINDITLYETAQILKESAIFLSFSQKESFGLPPAEAMACGCIVIGYHGQGGKEFFKTTLTYPIEQSDILTYAKCITHVIQEFDSNPEKMRHMGQAASAFILENYPVENQKKSILKMISQFI